MSEQPADFRTAYTPPSTEDLRQISPIILLTLGVLAGLVFGYLIFGGDEIVNERAHAYLTNAFTEGISIVITVVLVAAWQERQRIQREKKRLVREAGSRSNERAKAAVDDLRDLEWLKGGKGLLQGADLMMANLQRANLQEADLQRANLQEADLQGANLDGADLQGADLQGADLQGANLDGANLEGANLEGADLQGANLQWANLQSANLQSANLQSANLQGAKFQGANLMLAKLKEANLMVTDLQGAYLQGAKLMLADLHWANLEGAKLSLAKLQGAYLSEDIYHLSLSYKLPKIVFGMRPERLCQGQLFL